MSNRDLSDRLVQAHGGYRELRSFQAARLVYYATVIFCDRFLDRRSRTHDQMVQAARSGVQNIAEGSMASATSRKTEIRLTGVARASLEELLLDYEDFLRQRRLRIWHKDSSEALAVRRKYRSDWSDDGSDGSDASDWSSDGSDTSDPYQIGSVTPDVAANTLICLVNQASYLLRRQLQVLERAFLQEGGFSERMYRMRRSVRR